MRAKEFLDKPTGTVESIAKKHGVSVDVINAQLKKGMPVELEHTSNHAMAKEIALDHLGEQPDYYDKLETVEVSEDWNKVNHHDKTNGLSQKAVNAYRREHPGSKLKTAVTTKPSKLKAGSKDAKRRKSFCARMSGNKGPMKKPNGKPTPKALALRRWNCESINEGEGDPAGVKHVSKELIAHIIQQVGTEGAHAIVKSLQWGDGAAKELLQLIVNDLKQDINMAESVKQRLDKSCWKNKHKAGTKIKGGVRVNKCVPNEGVAEGSPTMWEVCFDYGPHMSDTVKVKAGSEDEAIAKVEKAAEKRGRSIDINWAKPAEQGVAEGNLSEFAPGNGGGESGRWYTDDDMTNIVGDGWWQDLDISGDVSKQEMINEAQGWLLDQGYRVQVLNVKVNDDDCEWYIEGSFQNPRFAKKDMSEGTHTFDPMKGIHALFALERQYKSGNIGTYEELMKKLGDHTQWTNVVGHNLKQAIPGFTVNDFWTLDNIVRDLSDGYGLPEWFRIINDGGWEDLIEKYKHYMSQRHGQTMNEQGVVEGYGRYYCSTDKKWKTRKGPKQTRASEEVELEEKWSQKYKNSINCSNPKGFSQKAHCAGKKK